MRSLITTVQAGERRFAGVYWREGSSRSLVVKMPVLVWHGENYAPEWDRAQRGWWVLLIGFAWSRKYGIEWRAGKAAIGPQEVLYA